MKRRNFIKTTIAGATAVVVVPSLACSPGVKKTGLILYTVRDDMNKNAEASLDRIAEIGYNWLEAADYANGKFYGKKPADFRKMVESRAMELISSHNGLNKDNLDEVVGAAAEAGLKYLVIPSLPHTWMNSADALKKTADFMNMAGEKCRENGMKLGFHNHTVEFETVEGLIPYDVFLNNTDPALVTFQLDLAWITKSGNNPIEYFEKYPGRFELWHVKDLSEEKQDATLGEGTMDFKPIFARAASAGMKYFFVEQDDCRTHTPFESIEISRNYLLENIL
ncbi:MAG: sugar phosphate isomerase/epimerase [Bacteroidales bacterium]|nr:sugar phosphate isomerase/epimerase [Bacteroidales bacterium]